MTSRLDLQGNIWFNSHRTAWISKLDPNTGIVEDHKVPSTAGANPGQHWITVDKNDVVWFSENWSHKLGRYDPKYDEMKHVQLPHFGRPLNAPGAGNLALSPDGFIWEARGGSVNKIDPATGQTVFKYMLKNVKSAYGNELSADGNYFAGGSWPEDWTIFVDIRKGEVFELQTRTPRIAPKRGGFDPDGNAWFGGAGGALVKIDAKTQQLSEYRAADAGRVVLRMPAGQERRDLGRRDSMRAASCATTRRPIAGPNMSCPSRSRTTGAPGSTTRRRRSASGTSTTTASWCACSRLE